MKFKSFAEALTADRIPQAANDNKPTKKPRQPRYRGTLPALRWLFDNYPSLAPALAAALPKPTTSWSADADDNWEEIRPTEGELMKAASDAFRVFVRNGVRHVGSGLQIESDEAGEWATLGSLRFLNGRLVEWGVTKKGAKLRPVDRIASGGGDTTTTRNTDRYVKMKPTAPSPLQASHLHRPISADRALPPMYDPQKGVAEARALLEALGVDGSVPFDRLQVPATKYQDAVAKGAGFLGGISSPKGNASSGAQIWEAPMERRGEVATVVEEVAARGTLKSIGLRLGYSDAYADRAGKAALIEAGKTLAAANDNKKISQCA